MRAPMGYAAIAFALGIGLAWRIEHSPAAIGIFMVLGGCCSLLVGRWRWAANLSFIVLIAALGMLRAAVDAQVPAHAVNRLIAEEPRPIVCRGTLASPLEWHRPPQGPARRQGWLDLTGVKQAGEWLPATGRVLLRLQQAQAPTPAYGDKVQLAGEVRGKRQSRWLWLQGACGVLNLSDPKGIEVLSSRPSGWVRYRRWVEELHQRLQSMGRSRLGPQEAAYLEGLLLGNRQGFSRELEEAFRKTGTVHVLVVSGLNVGLVGFLGAVVLSLVRVPRTPSYFLIALGLITYCLLTGSQPPILRATLMGVLLCVSAAGGRKFSGLNALGAAALGILGWDPRALADVGFQLSFAAVGGLLMITPWIEDKALRSTFGVKPNGSDPVKNRGLTLKTFSHRAIQLFSASAGAWVAVLPFLAWHFHLITPVAVVANLFVVPWASFLIAVGFLLYLLGWLHPLAAAPAAAVFGWMAQGLTLGVSWMARLPGASFSW